MKILNSWLTAAVATGISVIGATSLVASQTPANQNNIIKKSNSHVGVTNGTNAKPGSAPWFTTITYKKNPTDVGLGGSLINPYWLLSCGHDIISIKQLGAKTAAMRFNMYNKAYLNYSKIVYRNSSKIFINSNFVKTGVYNDVSLIKLNRPIYNLPYLNMPSQRVNVGDTVSVYGYGISGVDKSGVAIYPNNLQKGDIKVLDPKIVKNYPFAQFDSKLDILAGSTTGKRVGGALSDSGGPLVKWVNGQPTLVGVVSRGTEPYDYGWVKPAPGIYASVYANLSWIKNIIANN